MGHTAGRCSRGDAAIGVSLTIRPVSSALICCDSLRVAVYRSGGVFIHTILCSEIGKTMCRRRMKKTLHPTIVLALWKRTYFCDECEVCFVFHSPFVARVVGDQCFCDEWECHSTLSSTPHASRVYLPHLFPAKSDSPTSRCSRSWWTCDAATLLIYPHTHSKWWIEIRQRARCSRHSPPNPFGTVRWPLSHRPRVADSLCSSGRWSGSGRGPLVVSLGVSVS